MTEYVILSLIKIVLNNFKLTFSTGWKFTYLEFLKCSICPHKKKSCDVVKIIELLWPWWSWSCLGHGSVKNWNYCPYIMDSSGWHHQGHRRSIIFTTSQGFFFSDEDMCCKLKFNVREFSSSAVSQFKTIQMFSTRHITYIQVLKFSSLENPELGKQTSFSNC